MRAYSRICPTFWTGSTGRWLRSQPDLTTVVALYLMTCPAAEMTGLYYLSIETISHAIGADPHKVLKVLMDLQDEGFCKYDQEAECVFVIHMAQHQIGDYLNPRDKRVTGLKSSLQNFLKCPLLPEFLEEYGEIYHLEDLKDLIPHKGLPDSEKGHKDHKGHKDLPESESPLRPLSPISQEQEQEHEHEHEHEHEQERTGAEPQADSAARSSGKTKPKTEPSAEAQEIAAMHWRTLEELHSKVCETETEGTWIKRQAIGWDEMLRHNISRLDAETIFGFVLTPNGSFWASQITSAQALWAPRRGTGVRKIHTILDQAHGRPLLARPPNKASMFVTPETNIEEELELARIQQQKGVLAFDYDKEKALLRGRKVG